MRKLAIPFGAARRRQTAVEEAPYFDPTQAKYDDNNQYDDGDDDDKHDYDSFGSLPKGEVARRLRFGKEARPGRSGSPVGIRLRLDGMSSASSTMSKCKSNTVGRAAVSAMPIRRRPMARDPPSRDGASEPEDFRQPMRNLAYQDKNPEYYESDAYGYEMDVRMYEEENFQDFDQFAAWSNPRRQRRMMPWRGAPSQRQQLPHDVLSDGLTDESRWENLTDDEGSDGRGYTGLEIGKSVGGIAKGNVPVARLPPLPPQPKAQIRVTSYLHNPRDSLSDSMASSMSSGAPVYTPEDSKFLLSGSDEDDWAELPTQRDDPELRQIRKEFLRQDNSSSSNGSLGNSTITSRSSKLNQGNRDTEGLPTGFYRRKDGVILSMESSVGSSTNRQSTRYTNSITEASAMESTLETRESNKYAMDVQESAIEEENSIIASTLTETIPDSTVATEKEENNSRNGCQHHGLVAAFAQSFEDQIYYLRTGLERNPEKVHQTPLNRQRAKVRNGSVASSTSTPSTVRRAKVRQSALNVASTLAKSREAQKVPPIPSSTQQSPPHPLGMQHLDEQTSGSDYDDSTITTKDTAMQTRQAIIDTSRIPEEDRADYLVSSGGPEDSPSRDPSVPLMTEKRRKEVATDSVDLAKRHNDRKIALQVPSDDGFFQNSKKSSKKTVGFAGAYPEPTRRGDRVPELISPTNGASALPSVVSDISSLPRPKSKESVFDMSSKNGYGGFTVEDNISGFIDKMALALRQAVFQQAKGCTEMNNKK